MKQRRTKASRPFAVSATALAIGCVTLSGVAWHVRAASVQGSASVTVVAPSAVSAQNDILIRLNAPIVSGSNFSVGTSSQAALQTALAAALRSTPAGSTSAQAASFGVFGTSNQVFSVSVPQSAVMVSGGQVVEVGGLQHTAGSSPSVGQAGTGVFEIEFSQARVTTLVDLGQSTGGAPVLPDLLNPFGTTQSEGEDAGQGGEGIAQVAPINRPNPFQAVNNVGPFFYVTISYN